MNRSIIHLNVADFAVAVERVIDRRLQARPVIIAPEGAARAAVYDMSEEAYQAGIRKGMSLRRAIRLCSDVQILPPHPARYEQAMRDLLKRALPYSPLIEPGQDDGHLFVDVTGTNRLFGPPVDVAWNLRKQIKSELELDPIWSLASNKLVAKVATRIVKPAGEYIVSPGQETTFLAPLPIRLLPGIESRDLIRLSEFNLTTVSQVTTLGPDHLQIPFGKRAGFIYETMQGIDRSPVSAIGKKTPRITAGHDFGNDTNDEQVIKGILYTLVEQICRRLRRQQQTARRAGVIIDYSDGLRRARQVAIKPATANDFTLFQRADQALALAWTRRTRIRHICLICDRLVFPPAQLSLFEEDQKSDQKQTDLISAIDKIRNRFGHNAIEMGRVKKL